MMEEFRLIEEAIDSAERESSRLTAAMAKVWDQGLWPVMPREEFQSRCGTDGKYLYLVFPKDGQAGYKGPGGKQKVYVGCRAAAIVEARAKATRRVQYDQLERKLHQVRGALSMLRAKLQGVVTIATEISAERWDVRSRLFET